VDSAGSDSKAGDHVVSDVTPEVTDDGISDLTTDVTSGPLALPHFFPETAPLNEELAVPFPAAGGQPPYVWSVEIGSLPPGTTLDESTGILSGAASQEGVFSFLLQVADSAGDSSRELFGIRVGDAQSAGPMSTRAAEYQAVYEARHLWHGLSLGAKQPDDPDGDYQLTTYGDCAFVSGQCTMAMAFRYAVEPSDEALAVVTEQVDGWRFFQALTGVKGLIGRGFAHESDPSEDTMWTIWYPDNDKHKGEGEFEGWYWQGDTSRDQMTGAVLGVAMANALVADDHVREASRDFLVDVADHVWDNGLNIVDPDGVVTTHGLLDGEVLEGWPIPNGLNAVCLLAWFKIAYVASGEERFLDYYEELIYGRDYLSILRDAMWVYAGYSTKWYNTYMAWENWFHLMRLEQDPALRPKLAGILRDTLWLNVDDKSTPNRRGIAEHNPTKTTWYLFSTDEKDPEALYHALWQLRIFPEAPLRDEHKENSANPDIEPNPDRPDEALYPLPAPLHVPDMVMWHRSPFQLDGGQDNGEERTGCDYLLPYWMGRYYGYVSEDW